MGSTAPPKVIDAHTHKSDNYAAQGARAAIHRPSSSKRVRGSNRAVLKKAKRSAPAASSSLLPVAKPCLLTHGGATAEGITVVPYVMVPKAISTSSATRRGATQGKGLISRPLQVIPVSHPAAGAASIINTTAVAFSDGALGAPSGIVFTRALPTTASVQHIPALDKGTRVVNKHVLISAGLISDITGSLNCHSTSIAETRSILNRKNKSRQSYKIRIKFLQSSNRCTTVEGVHNAKERKKPK